MSSVTELIFVNITRNNVSFPGGTTKWRSYLLHVTHGPYSWRRILCELLRLGFGLVREWKLRMEYFVLNHEVKEEDGKRVHYLSRKGTISPEKYKETRKRLVLAEQFGKLRDLIYMQDKNGSDLKNYIEPFSLFERSKEESITYDEMLREANRLAFNFASSLKSAVEISETFLNHDQRKIKQYRERQSEFFDKVPGYRFWIRLRNYLVHHRQLYTGCDVKNGRAIVICSASRLLEWHGWNTVLKDDIKQLDGTNCYLTIYPAILSFHFLVSEWIFLNQTVLEDLKHYIEDLRFEYGITDEMYFSTDKDRFYCVPMHDLKNMESRLVWRSQHYNEEGFARLRGEYVPEELRETIQNPSYDLDSLFR